MKRKTSLTSFGFNEKVKYRNFDIEVKVADFVKINIVLHFYIFRRLTIIRIFFSLLLLLFLIRYYISMIRFEPQNILKMLLIFGTSLKCFYKLGSYKKRTW